MKKRGDGKRKTVHHLIDEVLKSDGLVPVMLIFGDRNDDDRMLLTGQVIREDFTRLLAKAAVFAETGRPGSEEEVAYIVAAVKTAVSQQSRCPACGDDRTGKGSLLYKKRVFCNEVCFEQWQKGVVDEAENP